MKAGLIAGYSPATMSIPMDLIKHAESLGFSSVWTAEAWGSDAVSPAAWILAQTQKIHVGTAIMQMPARTPAATAMTAMTLYALSGGRLDGGNRVRTVFRYSHRTRFATNIGKAVRNGIFRIRNVDEPNRLVLAIRVHQRRSVYRGIDDFGNRKNVVSVAVELAAGVKRCDPIENASNRRCWEQQQ